jgi:hypothetical protein
VRVKTSITLSEDLRGRLAHVERLMRDRKDVEIIDRNADRLNREAMDVLGYQQVP